MILLKNVGPSFARKKNSQDQDKCYYTLRKNVNKKADSRHGRNKIFRPENIF